jgi:hypothetical protein
MTHAPVPESGAALESASMPDAGLIDLASAIAGKFAADAAWCRTEASRWDREADQYAHIPGYAAWARRRCADYRRDAAESENNVRRALRAAGCGASPAL